MAVLGVGVVDPELLRPGMLDSSEGLGVGLGLEGEVGVRLGLRWARDGRLSGGSEKFVGGVDEGEGGGRELELDERGSPPEAAAERRPRDRVRVGLAVEVRAKVRVRVGTGGSVGEG